MTHTLEQTREILKQIQSGMGPLPAGFDLETLVCQTVSAMAHEARDHTFVIEPPEHPIHVQGEAADLIQALSSVLHALVGLTPAGTHLNVWTFAQTMDRRNWVAIRIRENARGLRRDGREVEQAMQSVCSFVDAMGASLEVAWDSCGAAELSLWLPCFDLVELLDADPAERAS